ncbi:MAG: CBS domain-containing protein [Candidatus Rokubacteria bacterium]|nr:CBS domain-containing protein [Candidatus Rokubacteria bacterium]
MPVVEDGRLVGILTERDLLPVPMKESPGAGVDPEILAW